MAFVQLLDLITLSISYRLASLTSPLSVQLSGVCNVITLPLSVVTSTEDLLYLARSHVISDIPVADTYSTPKQTSVIQLRAEER